MTEDVFYLKKNIAFTIHQKNQLFCDSHITVSFVEKEGELFKFCRTVSYTTNWYTFSAVKWSSPGSRHEGV